MRAVSFGKLTLAAICMAGLVLAAAPLASATSFTLSNTNLSGVTNVGTVDIVDSGTDQVTVTITMNAGFSVKLEGGQIGFNGPSGLTAGSVGSLTGFSGANTYSGLSFNNFKTTQNVSQFGTFAFDYANIQGAPGGVVLPAWVIDAEAISNASARPGPSSNGASGASMPMKTPAIPHRAAAFK